MNNTYAYQHLLSSSHVPEDCPSALQPAEQAQSPKVHRKPASVVMRKLKSGASGYVSGLVAWLLINFPLLLICTRVLKNQFRKVKFNKLEF